MGKIRFFPYLGTFLVLFFISTSCPKITYALEESSKDIVITEVMYNPDGSDTYHEWIEILNISSGSVDLTGWKFNDGSNHILNIPEGSTNIIIGPGEYLILADNALIFKSDYPEYSGQLVDTATSPMNNTTATISLIDKTGIIRDQFTYQSTLGGSDNKRTLEKIVPEEENVLTNWQESFTLGGTPGLPVSEKVIPDYPQEVKDLVNLNYGFIYTVKVSSIVDGDTIKVSGLIDFPADVRLLGIDTPELGQTLYSTAKNFTSQLLNQSVDLIISQNSEEQLDLYNRTLAVIIYNNQVYNPMILEKGLGTFFESDNSLIKTSAWTEIEEYAEHAAIGIWASSAGRSVILSEMLPDPIGSDDYEWIEIYNPLDREINLSYFRLEAYIFPFGTVLAPKKFLVLNKLDTGITLNNDGKTVSLLFPDGLLVDNTKYSSAGSGESWALIDDTWQWTTEVTPNGPNILSQVNENVGGVGDEKSEIPVNSLAVTIQTAEVKNFQNYLVTISGVVVDTSGNTFYLDDGSGRAKVYIQEKTGINKPPMHRGDIFQITGIVDLYRNIWRILPQKQVDVLLIETASKSTPVSKKTVSVKKSSTTTTSNMARAPTELLTVKKVEAAEDGIKGEERPKETNFLMLQIVKMSVAFAVILLVIVLLRLRSIKKHQPFGKDFGDET